MVMVMVMVKLNDEDDVRSFPCPFTINAQCTMQWKLLDMQ